MYLAKASLAFAALFVLGACASIGEAQSEANCALLEVVSVDTESSTQGVIYTIANQSDEPRQFRVYRRGVQSSVFSIEAGETRSFGVAVEASVAGVGGVISSLRGDTGVALNDCTPPSGSASLALKDEESRELGTGPSTNEVPGGMQSRALGNVNMRAGPGTGHRILGVLRPGDEVAVVRVVGTWCECMTREGRRVYVSCSLLSAPPGGWVPLRETHSSTVSVPSFPEGTPYPRVRAQLMQMGWSPYTPPGEMRVPAGIRPRGCTAGDDACRGFSETIFCIGASSHNCWHAWRRGQQHLLLVAVGEMEGQLFGELRECSAIVVTNDHPWRWCEPLVISRAAARPSVPNPVSQSEIRVPGACPFEGCQLGAWSARRNVPLFSAPNGAQAGVIRRGQAVTALEGEVRAAPRRATVTRVWDSDREQGIRVGSTVDVLHPGGEGTVVVLHEGRIVQGSLDLALRYDRPLSAEPLRWTWWVRVRSAGGITGWLRNPQGAFDGMDAFG